MNLMGGQRIVHLPRIPGEPNVFGSERAVNASCVDDRVQVRWKTPLVFSFLEKV